MTRFSTFLARLILVLGCFTASGAWAQGQVQTELRADRIVRQANGSSAAAPAQDARPGDTVVYTAAYRNTGRDAVRQLVATVPVPVGLEWQGPAADDRPQPSLASADGVNFAPIPLTRKVRGADGKEQVQPVPLQEYRALRWIFPELPAGAVTTVKATTRVGANQ